MKRWMMMAAAVCALIASGASAQMALDADETKHFPSVEAGLEWLKFIDEGDYSASWENSAAYVKQVMPKDQWEKALSGARAPFEALVSRQIRSNMPTRSLPGAPDGEYDVITFDSSFAKKAAAVETVTVMKEADGVWRVAGYYIK